MKVLIDHTTPFLLVHGGLQTQIEQTKTGLEANQVEVEYLRWWDDSQRGDLIHYFGQAAPGYLQYARKKGIPVAMTTLFTGTCNRSDLRLRLQGRVVQALLKLPFGEDIKARYRWRSFSLCSQNIVSLEAERFVLQEVYKIPPERISLVPYGMSDIFLKAGAGDRSGDFLICAGTITERKNSIPLATLARQAQVPISFVGKPYSETDPYWLKFQKLIDGRWVLHERHVSNPADMVKLLKRARGALVMSWYENWCLSIHEAAACGLPLLLPRQKWAVERFGDKAHYFTGNLGRDAKIMREFYDRCPTLPAPGTKLHSWNEVGQQLRVVYENLLKAAR